MEFFIRLAHPFWTVGAVVAVALAWFLHKKRRPARYTLATTSLIIRTHTYFRSWRLYTTKIVRGCILTLLCVLVGRPQISDRRTTTQVHGIDIVLALDVSGSMDTHDFPDDSRTRLQIAIDEARRFCAKRIHDAIGVVLFANEVLCRCPLTLDKKVLDTIIADVQLGILNPDGTKIAEGIVAAINRLKYSPAKSKIIIVLTDGTPSAGDWDINDAVNIAQKLGIKIYTIGIGSEEGQVLRDPTFGMILGVREGVNKVLLEQIARATGGTAFMARKKDDMRAIYDTIDQLEKTKLEAPLLDNYIDYCVPLLWALVCFFLLGIVLEYALGITIG